MQIQPIKLTELTVGQVMQLERVVTEQIVRDYASITGDWNKIHVDKAFAARTPFKECVVHGSLLSGFASALIAMQLGAHVMSADAKFRSPVKVGATVVVRVTVKRIKKKLVKVAYVCFVKETPDVSAIEGEALCGVWDPTTPIT